MDSSIPGCVDWDGRPSLWNNRLSRQPEFVAEWRAYTYAASTWTMKRCWMLAWTKSTCV